MTAEAAPCTGAREGSQQLARRSRFAVPSPEPQVDPVKPYSYT